MGKIRIRTLGSGQEKEEKKQAQKRSEAKKVSKKQAEVGVETATVEGLNEKTKEKKKVVIKKKGSSHSQKYLSAVSTFDKAKEYKLKDALSILEKIKQTKFDETIELHINTTEKGISGNVVLPHGTGKSIRVAVANQSADPKGVEELVAAIEKGNISFDILIATPDSMPKLARVARILGPKGLMPNPKNGTVSPKPEESAKKFEGGQMNYKTEAKFPIIHMSVGKLSFGPEKLAENIKSAVAAVETKKIRNVTLKSTMSPGIKLETTSL